MMSIAVYFVQRLFGGNEEGGWWFDSGELCTAPDLMALGITIDGGDQEQASIRQRDIQLQLDRDWNVGEHARSLDSVLSPGRYQAHIFDGWPPQCFPEVRPTYE